MTTIYYGTVMDVPTSPFDGGELRAETVALAVVDGQIALRGPLAEAQAAYPEAETVRFEGILIPGMVDTHVHFPQLPIIGGLGMPLLEWLDKCALPQEARLADDDHARDLAGRFLSALARAGTTSALVFGSHFASAVDLLFEASSASGLRITSGMVVSDRNLRPELHTTPEVAREEMAGLIDRWHGQGKVRYAVTPRFSFSASEAILEACRDALDSAPGVYFTSHVNENPDEVRGVAALFPQASSYADTYDQFGLLTDRSVLAHNVHPTAPELARMAATGTSVAHCPTSNASLGSGMFPMAAHLEAGVRFALGSDVGGGTGLSLIKEGLQSYFHQRLQADGYPLTPAHLLYLATRAGALALGLPQVGHLGEGMAFDAVNFVPVEGSTFSDVLGGAQDPSAALAALFTLGTDADVAAVYVDGAAISRRPETSAKVPTALSSL